MDKLKFVEVLMIRFFALVFRRLFAFVFRRRGEKQAKGARERPICNPPKRLDRHSKRVAEKMVSAQLSRIEDSVDSVE